MSLPAMRRTLGYFHIRAGKEESVKNRFPCYNFAALLSSFRLSLPFMLCLGGQILPQTIASQSCMHPSRWWAQISFFCVPSDKFPPYQQKVIPKQQVIIEANSVDAESYHCRMNTLLLKNHRQEHIHTAPGLQHTVFYDLCGSLWFS